jgi:hypothetical protein
MPWPPAFAPEGAAPFMPSYPTMSATSVASRHEMTLTMVRWWDWLGKEWWHIAL